MWWWWHCQRGGGGCIDGGVGRGGGGSGDCGGDGGREGGGCGGKSMYRARVWPGQKAKISPSLAPAQPKQPWQAAGPTSPGRPKGKNRLGSSPSSGDVNER
ncbi:hypothetical protein L3X38_012252 [Prunus dulcis]|uniref:Uncharacterized protein n=1 Tax=Prunus dulcis TaxID=3755 RepID=A0AAD4WIZ7_PRUDU|nr:hypothetical protein L3X38_012252 [Prunus dulcis]